MGVAQDMGLEKGTKGTKTKLLILRKAIELFALHGYDGTSFQMIADELEVSQAAPLYHFKNKFGLFEAAIRLIVSDMRELELNESASGLVIQKRLGLFVSKFSNWFIIRASEGQLLFLLFYFASFENSFAALYDEFQTQLLAQLKSLLAKESEFSPEEVDLVAVAMLDFMLGLSISLLAGRRNVLSPYELHERIQFGVSAILGDKGTKGMKS